MITIFSGEILYNKTDEIYYELSSIVSDIEEQKKLSNQKFYTVFAVIIGIIILLIYFNVFESINPVVYIIVGLYIAMMIRVAYFRKFNDKNIEFKKQAVKKVITSIVPDMECSLYSESDSTTHTNINFDNGYIKRYNDILVDGVYNQTKTQIYITENKRTIYNMDTDMPSDMYIYSGVHIILDFNKYFNGSTIVYAKNNLTRQILYNEFKLDNPLFNEYFDVYTTDIQEATYILSQNFMENLVKLYDFVGQNSALSIHFINNCMYVHLRNMSLLNSFDSKDYKERVRLFYNNMKEVFQVIEFLELDERIWTKK